MKIKGLKQDAALFYTIWMLVELEFDCFFFFGRFANTGANVIHQETIFLILLFIHVVRAHFGVITSHLCCLVFVERNVQSNLVSSIYMSLELRTNHSTGEPQSNQFHRNHHNGWPSVHFVVDHPTGRHVFVGIVGSFGSLGRVVLVSLLLMSMKIHLHLDKISPQQAYLPTVEMTVIWMQLI